MVVLAISWIPWGNFVPVMRFLASMATAELMASGSEGFMPVTAALGSFYQIWKNLLWPWQASVTARCPCLQLLVMAPAFSPEFSLRPGVGRVLLWCLSTKLVIGRRTFMSIWDLWVVHIGGFSVCMSDTCDWWNLSLLKKNTLLLSWLHKQTISSLSN